MPRFASTAAVLLLATWVGGVRLVFGGFDAGWAPAALAVGLLLIVALAPRGDNG